MDIADNNCTQCNLYAGCKTVCNIAPLKEDKVLMIIDSYPTEEDDTNGTTFSSKKYTILKDMLLKAIGADFTKIHFTYFIKCKVAKESDITPTDIAACKHYLAGEIDYIKPKAIVTLGAFTSHHLTNKGAEDIEASKISTIRGKIVKLKLDGVDEEYKVIPTYSPSYAAYNSRGVKPFAEDLHKAYTLATDGAATKVSTVKIQIETVKAAKEFIDTCVSVGTCSFDFEANSLEWHKSTFKATGIAISYQHGVGAFIPLLHHESPFNITEVREILQYFVDSIILNPDVHKVGQNIKFDLHVLQVYANFETIEGRVSDTMVMDALVDDTQKHGLKEMVYRYFRKFAGYEDAVKKYDWSKVPLDILGTYAVVDSDLTLRVQTRLEGLLLEDERVYRIYRNIVMPATKLLFFTEARGMLVDRKYLEDAILDVEAMIAEEQEIVLTLPATQKYILAKTEELKVTLVKETQDKAKSWTDKGKRTSTKTYQNYLQRIAELKTGVVNPYKGFNLNSPAQLKDLFYNHPEGLQFDPPKSRWGKAEYSTKFDIIKNIEDSTGFIKGLLKVRSLNKTNSVYLTGIHEKLDINDRVHTNYFITGTSTGRISSKNPNLQNLKDYSRISEPKARKAAEYIKTMFTPPKGHYIIQVDYSQAELRLVAYYAQCLYMLDAYSKGVDQHSLVAADMMGLTLEEFYELPKKEQKLKRFYAKAVNFGLIYGMSAEKFREYAKNQYGVEFTVKEARKIRNDYFAKRPELLTYHKHYQKVAKKFGYVRTLFGRRRQLPDIKEQGFKLAEAERAAINTPIQGTGGEITLLAGILLSHWLPKEVKLANTIHDSLIYYIPEAILDTSLATMKYVCENLPYNTYFGRSLSEQGKIPVGMLVDAEVSLANWKSLEEYEIK